MFTLLCLLLLFTYSFIESGTPTVVDAALVESLLGISEFNFELLSERPDAYMSLVFIPRTLPDNFITSAFAKAMGESLSAAITQFYENCGFLVANSMGGWQLNNFENCEPSYSLLRQCYRLYPEHFKSWECYDEIERSLQSVLLFYQNILNPLGNYHGYLAYPDHFHKLWMLVFSKTFWRSLFLQTVLLAKETVDQSYFNLMSQSLDSKNLATLTAWMHTDLESRWRAFVRDVEKFNWDLKLGMIVKYLVENNFDQFIAYAKKYGTPSFHLSLCNSNKSKKILVLRDFSTFPTSTSCCRPFITGDVFVTGSPSLPSDIFYKIFLSLLRSDFSGTMNQIRLVCHHWRAILTFHEPHQLQDMLSASPKHSKQFMFDVVAQYSRNMPIFDVWPWMKMSNQEARSVLVGLIEAHDCEFGVDQLVKDQVSDLEFFGRPTYEPNTVSSANLVLFKIFQQIMDEQAISDKLAKYILKNVENTSLVFCKHSVWPTVNMFIDSRVSLSSVDMTAENKLKFFDCVFFTLRDNQERNIFLGKCALNDKETIELCEKALILYHFYGSLRRETLEYVLDKLCPAMRKRLDSKEFVFRASIDSLNLRDERKRPELEFIIAEIMNENIAAHRSTHLKDCLKYVCAFRKDDTTCIRRLIEICIQSGIPVTKISEYIAFATIQSRFGLNS
jgi:hypothetical protein